MRCREGPCLTAPAEHQLTVIDDATTVAALIRAADRQVHLQRAVDGRTLIGQAQGVLIERYHLTPVDAFAALRRHSQHHNRKIGDLAEELVATGGLPHLGTPIRPTAA